MKKNMHMLLILFLLGISGCVSPPTEQQLGTKICRQLFAYGDGWEAGWNKQSLTTTICSSQLKNALQENSSNVIEEIVQRNSQWAALRGNQVVEIECHYTTQRVPFWSEWIVSGWRSAAQLPYYFNFFDHPNEANHYYHYSRALNQHEETTVAFSRINSLENCGNTPCAGFPTLGSLNGQSPPQATSPQCSGTPSDTGIQQAPSEEPISLSVCTSCSQPLPAPTCGNSQCEETENTNNCAIDCAPPPTLPESCLGNGITGPSVPRFLLTWEPNEIRFDSCEQAYCDPYQASWSLLDRLERIDQALRENNNEWNAAPVQALTRFSLSLTKGRLSPEFFSAFTQFVEENEFLVPAWFSKWKPFLISAPVDPDQISDTGISFHHTVTQLSRLGFYRSVEINRATGSESILYPFADPQSFSPTTTWFFEAGQYPLQLEARFENENQPTLFRETENGFEPNAILLVIGENQSGQAQHEKPIVPVLFDLSFNGTFGQAHPEFGTTFFHETGATPLVIEDGLSSSEWNESLEGNPTTIFPTDLTQNPGHVFTLTRTSDQTLSLQWKPSQVQWIMATGNERSLAFTTTTQAQVLEQVLLATQGNCAASLQTPIQRPLETSQGKTAYQLDHEQQGIATSPRCQNSNTWHLLGGNNAYENRGNVLGILVQTGTESTRLNSCSQAEQFATPYATLQSTDQTLDISSTPYRATTWKELQNGISNSTLCILSFPNYPSQSNTISVVWNTERLTEHELAQRWNEEQGQYSSLNQCPVQWTEHDTTPRGITDRESLQFTVAPQTITLQEREVVTATISIRNYSPHTITQAQIQLNPQTSACSTYLSFSSDSLSLATAKKITKRLLIESPNPAYTFIDQGYFIRIQDQDIPWTTPTKNRIAQLTQGLNDNQPILLFQKIEWPLRITAAATQPFFQYCRLNLGYSGRNPLATTSFWINR